MIAIVNRENSAGATMVEMALIVGLFFFLVLTFIDATRYFAVYSLVTRGAQQALTLAEVAEGFDFDFESTDSTEADFTRRFTKYKTARAEMVERGTRLALSTMAISSTDPASIALPVRLIPFSTIDLPGASAPDFESEVLFALILRPGDSGRYANGDLIHHPDRCSPRLTSVSFPCPRPRLNTDSMDRMLAEMPLVVRIEAEVFTYSPWLPNLIARGEAQGYRERPVETGFADGMFSPSKIDNASRSLPPPPENPEPCTRVTEDNCPLGTQPDNDERDPPRYCRCIMIRPPSCPEPYSWDGFYSTCLGMGG